MAYQPSPKQALFLWNLICSRAPEGVLQSKTRPELTLAERTQLIKEGFLTLVEYEARAGKYLASTDNTWAWASKQPAVSLMKSSSPVGAEILEALLHRLVPYIEKHELTLADLFPLREVEGPPLVIKEEGSRPKAPKPKKSKAKAQSLGERIEQACLSLAQGKRKTRVRLSALRHHLDDVERSSLDRSLLEMQDAQRILLYRDDNTAGLTDEDRLAALIINNEPRHLVLLEAGA